MKTLATILIIASVAFFTGCPVSDNTNTNTANTNKAITPVSNFEQSGVSQEKTGEAIRRAQKQGFKTFKFEFYTPPIIGGYASTTITGFKADFPPIEAPNATATNVPDDKLWPAIQGFQAQGYKLFQFKFNTAKRGKVTAEIVASFGDL